MERLTNREYGEISCTEYTSHCDACLDGDCHCGFVEDMVEKLADYEDLEEQGRLIKLPCKVGDTVYKIDKVSNKIKQYKVIHFEVSRVDFDTYNYCFLHHFGKTVFLTKEEAEAKLKELRGRENE
nr:MAG TPA: hypothetical protein [Caudoviricetes sp.]